MLMPGWSELPPEGASPGWPWDDLWAAAHRADPLTRHRTDPWPRRVLRRVLRWFRRDGGGDRDAG